MKSVKNHCRLISTSCVRFMNKDSFLEYLCSGNAKPLTSSTALTKTALAPSRHKPMTTTLDAPDIRPRQPARGGRLGGRAVEIPPSSLLQDRFIPPILKTYEKTPQTIHTRVSPLAQEKYTMKIAPPHRLNAVVRARVNQLAHRLGLAHENALRAKLLARLATSTSAGATVAELNKLIDELESGPAPVDSAPIRKGASRAA